MNNIKSKKRAVALSLAMSMVLALPVGALAQSLFQRGVTDEEYYGAGDAKNKNGLFGNRNVQTTGTINNQVFGQPVPLGSGLAILLVAGAGYVALKRKEDEK